MGKPLVGIVLGSRADFNVMKRGLESLRVMGVPYLFELASAHRSPERLARFAAEAAGRGLEVLLCAGGGSVQIASMLASHTVLPIVAVPIDATPLRGQDALYSLIQSAPGAPVAVVGINNAENAALLVTQMLGLKFPRYREVLQHQRLTAAQRLETTFKELLTEFPDLCTPERTAPENNPATKAISDNDTDPGEDATPEPEVPPAQPPVADRIRPGATLDFQHQQRVAAGSLIPTPRPQEPDNQTEDPELREELTPPRPVHFDFPPPPKLHDLAPLANPLPTNPLPASPKHEPFSPSAITPRDDEAPLSKALDVVDAYVETKIFQVDHSEPDVDVLTHAMLVLLEGGIVAFPTDTVYGLAADATNPEAVRRLYETKGHEASRKSLSVLIHHQDLLETLVREVPATVETALSTYWPGTLTVLFYKHPNVLPMISESPSIAVRIPHDGVALRVLNMVERPLVVINASIGASPMAVDAREVIERFDGKIDCVLDAGPCSSAKPSTVLSVLNEPFEVLREGSIAVSELARVLGPRLKARE
jgi:tRNA threonylcarbamoyl adenosine modification protein (Sua5/YciO/YrdC/YwlC family)